MLSDRATRIGKEKNEDKQGASAFIDSNFRTHGKIVRPFTFILHAVGQKEDRGLRRKIVLTDEAPSAAKN